MTIRIFGASRLPPSARKPRAIAAICRRILKGERAGRPGALNIVFLDRRKMRALNRRYLGKNHDTDVIAFSYAADPGPLPGERPFGDIFISAHKARTQAADLGHSVLNEVLILVAHGTLHLLGYDDSSPPQRIIMFHKQKRVVGL